MKKISRLFVILSAAVVALTVVPYVIRLLTLKPERTPFTLYSCVVHDFTALDHGSGREYRFIDRKGNVYDDSVQPLFYASILASKGQFPDSLEGRAVTLEEAESNSLFVTSDPKDVCKTWPPVYLLMESVPERLELQDPEDAMVSRRDGIYVYRMDSNELLQAKTDSLNTMLREAGFVFPARKFGGNPSHHKQYDEGYLVTDSEDKLYQIKQVGGLLQVRHFAQADGLGVRNVKITEFENHATLGMLVTGDGRLAMLRPDGSIAVTDVPFCPEKEDLLLVGDLFYYTVKTTDSDFERFYALDSQTYALVDTMTRALPAGGPGIPRIAFTSPGDSWVKPRLRR